MDAVIHRSTSGFGGVWRLVPGLVLEIAVSILLAPLRMLAHSRFVLAAFFNLSLKWAGQNRTDETTWSEALRSQLPGMIIGAGWSAFAWFLDRLFFYWSLPVALPLILAVPTSVLLSRVAIGEWLRSRGLLLVPEERAPLPILVDAQAFRAAPHAGVAPDAGGAGHTQPGGKSAARVPGPGSPGPRPVAAFSMPP